jgi:hypothetical protein
MAIIPTDDRGEFPTLGDVVVTVELSNSACSHIDGGRRGSPSTSTSTRSTPACSPRSW